MAIQKKTLPINGMHCAGCALGIEATLKNTPGIKKASVNYNTESAYIDFDDQKLTLAKIATIIKKIGYTAIVDEKKK